MSEDMTYKPVPTLADLRNQVAELERENAELRGKLDAVPVDDISALLRIATKPARAPFVRRRVGEWLAQLEQAVQP